MSLKVKIIIGVVIVLVVLLGLGAVKVWLLGKSQQQAASGKATIVTTTPPPPDTVINVSPTPDTFKFNNQAVGRIGGIYNSFTVGVINFTDTQGQARIAVVDSKTKVVCQPTGNLNGSSTVPANDIYIEDRSDGNAGIPWGVEMSRLDIGKKVTPNTKIDVYYSLDNPSLVNSFKARYVWFGLCSL